MTVQELADINVFELTDDEIVDLLVQLMLTGHHNTVKEILK